MRDKILTYQQFIRVTKILNSTKHVGIGTVTKATRFKNQRISPKSRAIPFLS